MPPRPRRPTIRYRPPRSVPGGKRPWSIAPELDSHPLDDEVPLERESLDAPGLAGLSAACLSPARRVMSSASGGRTVSIADGGSGVRHCGQNSPASCGTTIAAQFGQEIGIDTVADYRLRRPGIRAVEHQVAGR